MRDYWSCLRGFIIVRTEYSEAEGLHQNATVCVGQGEMKTVGKVFPKILLIFPEDLIYEEVSSI